MKNHEPDYEPMKIYKFYYKGNIDDSSILHPSSMMDEDWDELDDHGNMKAKTKYPLYAWTNIKKYSKEFKKTRNMDKFIMISSEVSREELEYLYTNYQDLVLNRYEFMTRTTDNEGFNDSKGIELVATQFEYLSSTEDHDMVMMEDSEFWEGSLPIQCYNKKIQKALMILSYPLLRNLYYKVYNGVIDDGFNYPDIAIDELNVFIYNFRETLG